MALVRPVRFDSVARKSSSPNPRSPGTARPTLPASPPPHRRPRAIYGVDHPHRVAPYFASPQRIAKDSLHQYLKCSSLLTGYLCGRSNALKVPIQSDSQPSFPDCKDYSDQVEWFQRPFECRIGDKLGTCNYEFQINHSGIDLDCAWEYQPGVNGASGVGTLQKQADTKERAEEITPGGPKFQEPPPKFICISHDHNVAYGNYVDHNNEVNEMDHNPVTCTPPKAFQDIIRDWTNSIK